MGLWDGQNVRLRKGDRVRVTVAEDCQCDVPFHPLSKAGVYVGTVTYADAGVFPYFPAEVQFEREHMAFRHEDSKVEILSRTCVRCSTYATVHDDAYGSDLCGECVQLLWSRGVRPARNGGVYV